MNKLHRFVFLLILIVLLSACNKPTSNTTSYIQVISKEVDKKSNFLVTVKNPNDKAAVLFKITIKDENLWNLIEVDRIYFSTYEYKDINEKVELLQIKYPAEPNSNDTN